MGIAAAISRAAKDVDGDLASGTAYPKSVAAMGGADEGLQRSKGSRELKRDGEGGSRRASRSR